MSSNNFRKLFYHAESDCYMLFVGEKGEQECAGMLDSCWNGEPLDDVTDLENHEIEYLKRKRAGLKG